MNVSWPLIVVFTLIVIVIIIMVIFNFIILANKKLDLIYIMRPYIYKIEDKGFLSNEEKSMLKSDLSKMKLYNIVIDIDNENSQFGALISVDVKTLYDIKWINGFLNSDNKPININYNRKIIIKRIVN